MYTFNANDISKKAINWISDYFALPENKGAKAVVGISGGKDSSVVATLCRNALGKENVIGVLMPQGEQFDIDYSKEICDFLGIKYVIVNIGEIAKKAMQNYTSALNELGYDEISTITTFNTPARIRMTTLYALSGTINGRVANTCNLSEDYVGYATKFGDGAGDFSPLMHLTVTEVRAIGRELGIPDKFVEKTPIDGLCGMSDEENLGFSYEILDRYIRENVCENNEIKAKIDRMYKNNLHKLLPMPHFKP